MRTSPSWIEIATFQPLLLHSPRHHQRVAALYQPLRDYLFSPQDYLSLPRSYFFKALQLGLNAAVFEQAQLEQDRKLLEQMKQENAELEVQFESELRKVKQNKQRLSEQKSRIRKAREGDERTRENQQKRSKSKNSRRDCELQCPQCEGRLRGKQQLSEHIRSHLESSESKKLLQLILQHQKLLLSQPTPPAEATPQQQKLQLLISKSERLLEALSHSQHQLEHRSSLLGQQLLQLQRFQFERRSSQQQSHFAEHLSLLRDKLENVESRLQESKEHAVQSSSTKFCYYEADSNGRIRWREAASAIQPQRSHTKFSSGHCAVQMPDEDCQSLFPSFSKQEDTQGKVVISQLGKQRERESSLSGLSYSQSIGQGQFASAQLGLGFARSLKGEESQSAVRGEQDYQFDQQNLRLFLGECEDGSELVISSEASLQRPYQRRD